jgi:hypothetical protein
MNDNPYYKPKRKQFYDIVYTYDNSYNPWGKPGGGAPLIDYNTNRLATKIQGSMQWNLNGLTPADKHQMRSQLNSSSYGFTSNSIDSFRTSLEKEAEERNLTRQTKRFNSNNNLTLKSETGMLIRKRRPLPHERFFEPY